MTALAIPGVGRARRVGGAALVLACGAVGLAVAPAIAEAPVTVAVAAMVVAAACVLVSRPVTVTAMLAGAFFFDDFFTERFGFWNPGKLLGILAAAALGLSWLRDRRPLRWTPQVPVIVAMGAGILVSYGFARDPGIGVETAIRYAMFFGLFFVVVQVVRDVHDVDLVIDTTVVAGVVAAVVGLHAFLIRGDPRVHGPLADPGDFAFQLACILPLIAYRFGTTVGLRRYFHGIAFALASAAVLGTFARAALLGLAVAGGWAMASGRLQLRWGAVALAVIAVVALAALRFEPELVETSLFQKQAIAQRNVDNRFGLWEVALLEWQSAPVFGVGPGQFEVRFPEFKSPLEQQVETTHNAYLNVLAELGLVGLALFAAYLALSWRELVHVHGGQRDPLRTALAAGFLVALVGACFMTQQFYPPLWFLAGIGAALNREDRLPSAQRGIR